MTGRTPRHHGWPVILETMPGRACPQIAQARIFRGTQVGQTGPSDVRVLTGLWRPQRAHRSRLAGSVLGGADKRPALLVAGTAQVGLPSSIPVPGRIIARRLRAAIAPPTSSRSPPW